MNLEAELIFIWMASLEDSRQKVKDTVLGNNLVMSIFQFVVNEVLDLKGGKFFARWSLYELNETRRCGKSEQNRVFLYFPCTFSSKVVHILRNCDQWERLKPGDLNYSIVEQPHSQEKPRHEVDCWKLCAVCQSNEARVAFTCRRGRHH